MNCFLALLAAQSEGKERQFSFWNREKEAPADLASSWCRHLYLTKGTRERRDAGPPGVWLERGKSLNRPFVGLPVGRR